MSKVRKNLIWFCLFFLPINTVYGQLVWEKYAGNPILREWSGQIDDPNGYKYAFEPTVFYDSTQNIFRMWLVSLAFGYGTRFNISKAISHDGKEWFVYMKNPVFRPDTPGSWDSNVRSPKVIFDGSEYKMYYTGQIDENYRIGLATSTDLETWEKYSGNPVLEPDSSGTWDDANVAFCDVYFDGTTYYMWYTGNDGTRSRIGLATSTDGRHWQRYTKNPVLTEGSSGWDSYLVSGSAVTVVNGIFYMVYSGSSTPGCCDFSLGLAYSSDGINWTRGPTNPILTPGPGWENVSLGSHAVLFHDQKFHLWYSGLNSLTYHWQAGYASSILAPLHAPNPSTLPSEFNLFQSFPNPFNAQTLIIYEIPKEVHVTITVFDALGQEVETLIDQRQSPGRHAVQWNAKNLSSGTYWCRMTTEGFSRTLKMTLLK